MQNKYFPLFVLFITSIIWFSLLGHRDLIDPDEARYAEIPREMVASGDWITPRLNDLKYFEKPVLQYWLTAVSFKLFGESNFSARLWLALSGYICALFIGFVGFRLYSKDAGYFAYLITISSLLFAVLGHNLTLDMSLTLFMTLGVGSLALAQNARAIPQQNRNWMLLGWASLAGAVLTKGLVAIVLPGAAAFFYMLWQRDWSLIKYLHLIKGLLLLFCLASPWFFMVSDANEEFFHFFFIREHFERFTTTEHRREGPIYYYIPILLLGVCPWLITSLSSLFKPQFSWRVTTSGHFDMDRFFWVYIVLVIIFFSLSGSKLPSYILPVFPFIALLAAKRITYSKIIKGDQWVLLVLSVVFFIIALFVEKFASELYPAELYANYRPWIIVAAIFFGLASISIFKLKHNIKLGITLASIFSLLSFQSLLGGFQEIGFTRSAVAEAAAISEQLPDTANVYALYSYPQALPFYLKRTITIVGYEGELEMGIHSEPHKWIPSLDEFTIRWNQESQAAAIMRLEIYEDLVNRNLSMTVISRGTRWIVVKR